MMTFLGVIAFIILGFWVLGLILRLFLKVFIARKVKEFQTKGGFTGFGGFSGGGQQAYGGGSSAESNKREGEIKVEKVEPDHKKISEKVGEYVEFDEIK